MIGHVVAHVLDPKQLEAAPVRPNNVIKSRSEDGSLPDLLPSLQVSKPAALSKVSNQVDDIVLRKEVRHALSLRAPCFVKVHIKNPKDNGVLEALQGLFQVRHMFQHRWW